MILNFAVNTNSFVYCTVYQGSNELTKYYNVGNGHFHQWMYVADGSADITVSESDTPTDSDEKFAMTAGNLYDLSVAQGKYTTTKTDNSSFCMTMFNPIPENKKLKVEILSGVQDIEVKATDKRVTVVCLTGPVTIKNKLIQSMQYAVVFSNSTARLVMSQHNLCALVTG